MTGDRVPMSHCQRGEAGSEERRLAVRAAAERGGPVAVTAIGRALADPDWRVRKEAAMAAGRLADDPAVVAMLVSALLQSEDVGLRNAAIEAFGYVGQRGASALIAALEEAPPAARKFVCAAMAGCGPEVVPALARVARDPDPNTATVAIESLARIGGAVAEQVLRDQLASKDPVVRLAALEGLGRLRARLPVSTLVPMTSDAVLRRFAIRLLGYSGSCEAAAPLVDAARSPSSTVELAEIVVALERLATSDPACAEIVAAQVRTLGASERAALRALLGEEDTQVASAAAYVLAVAQDLPSLPHLAALASRVELGPPVIAALRALGLDAVRPLLAEAPGLEPIARAWALELAAELAMVGTAEGSEDPTLAAELRAALRRAAESCDEVVVLAAVRALARWAEPEDAALLVRLGARGSSAVARAASEVLEALSMAAPASVEMALADAAPDAAEAWSAAVAVLPRDAALEKIRTAMSSGSPGARRAVVRVLDRLDSAEAAEIAALALTDEDFGVRVAAANVLARMHDASARTIAIRTLRLALCDSSAPVRAAAARGLGTLGDRGAVDVLRERLRDNGPEVVVAALGALRMLGMARTVDESELDEILSHVLGHRDEEVVKEALRFVAESVSARREARLSLGLRHPAWDVRQLAVTLLGEVGTPEALELLRERMAVESDDLVRASLAEVLRSKRG